jgi:integrase
MKKKRVKQRASGKKGEGHIRVRFDKDGNPKYQMIVEVWKNGIMHRKARTFSSEEEAMEWRADMRYEIKKGIITKKSLKDRTLQEAIDKYETEVLPLKPKNAHNVKQHLRWWGTRIGHLNLKDILPEMLDEYRDTLLKEPTHQGKKRANATVRHYLTSLSCVFLATVKKWHWIKINPLRDVEYPSISNTRKEALTPEECRQLLKACQQGRNPYLYAMVTLAIFTGMRKGEISNLRWENIDFDKNLIHLKETKNGLPHNVPMIPFISRTLKNLFERERVEDLTYEIFPRLNTRPIDIRTAFKFALKRAGLNKPGIVFHTLRHTCQTLLAISGASQRESMDLLNHKDVRSSHRYTHNPIDHLRGVSERAFLDIVTPLKEERP